MLKMPAPPGPSSEARLVTIPVVLGSGKPARLSVPEDMDAEDVQYLMRAVLDVAAELRKRQAAKAGNGILVPT